MHRRTDDFLNGFEVGYRAAQEKRTKTIYAKVHRDGTAWKATFTYGYKDGLGINIKTIKRRSFSGISSAVERAFAERNFPVI